MPAQKCRCQARSCARYWTINLRGNFVYIIIKVTSRNAQRKTTCCLPHTQVPCTRSLLSASVYRELECEIRQVVWWVHQCCWWKYIFRYHVVIKYYAVLVLTRVILYSGEPLSHCVEMAYLNTCAKSHSTLFWGCSSSIFSNRVPN